MTKKTTKTAAPAARPKRARRPAYKHVECKTSISAAIADGLSALEELGSECREVVDNAEGGLAETARIQTLGDTATTLEGLGSCSYDDCVSDLVEETQVTYHESVPSDKRRSPGRGTRCSNACAMLSAAIDGIRELLEDDKRELTQDQRDELEQLSSEVEGVVGDAEGCEFPGMFG